MWPKKRQSVQLSMLLMQTYLTNYYLFSNLKFSGNLGVINFCGTKLNPDKNGEQKQSNDTTIAYFLTNSVLPYDKF